MVTQTGGREMEERIDWYRKDVEEVLARLESQGEGLTAAEAQRRLSEFGYNKLIEKKKKGALAMFLGQFTDFMILILLAAAVVSAFLGEGIDSLAIILIVILNAILGFSQEYRAEKAMEALKAMSAPEALLLREGQTVKIPAPEIVPGDVVLLEAGNIIPADLRIIESVRIKADEASLTGESIPVEKTAKTLHDKHLPLGDRKNMAFMGTAVTYGRGKGIAVETGMKTEFGRIASMLQEEKEEKTPLQKRINDLGKKLSIAFLGICSMVFAIGLVRGGDPISLFIVAVSLAVAAIPEALPAVITIVLSIGAKRMVEAKALIRRLPAVETLGSITYICSDKTGTLTLNKMTVEDIYWNGKRWKLNDLPAASKDDGIRSLDFFIRIATLNTDAAFEAGKYAGDPTEIALLQLARGRGLDKKSLEKDMPRMAEIPFDSERKCMTTFHRWKWDKVLSITKGAPEVIISRCTRALEGGKTGPMMSGPLLAANDTMAGEGLRILAFGIREWSSVPVSLEPETIEKDLTFIGLTGMIDPPREETFEAVRLCKSAGIRPVMITGDHAITAKVIAQRLEILEHDHSLVTGTKLDVISLEELEEKVRDIQVYARVAPEQKLKIVKALQDKGEFVAMTGDGVNDAPSLKRADIGVAMGITGTDVSKEASDMILLDDNFATIVKAIREGRRIFDNILKFIKYILASNVGEITTIFLAPFFGLPLPLLPIQILWINLVTDGLPGIAFASEKEEEGIMQRPPRNPRESVFSSGLGMSIIWSGLFLGGITLLSQGIAIQNGLHWQTIAFNVLCLSQLGNALACRSFRNSLLRIGVTSNPFLFSTFLGTVLLQVSTIYLPFFNKILKTQPLSWWELSLVLVFSSLLFLAVEAEKWIRRMISKAPESI